MSNNGYDQFFKAAKKAKVQPAKHKFPMPKPDAEATIRKALHMPAARKTKPFPFVPVLLGAILVSAGLGYLLKPEAIDQLLQHVQVRMVGQLEAEVKAAKDSPPTAVKAEKDAAANPDAKKIESAAKDRAVAEDTSYIDKLRSRKDELDLREKELNQLEEELQRQKVEVDQRVRQLEQMRRDIASVLKERVDADETQVNKLVDLYSTMKPKQAADVIGSLQEDLAVQILGKMKKKNAAEVMNVLPSDKARTLSEKLTGYKR
jgi:flagellar motility protein MotE (MotC chaperone)